MKAQSDQDSNNATDHGDQIDAQIERSMRFSCIACLRSNQKSTQERASQEWKMFDWQAKCRIKPDQSKSKFRKKKTKAESDGIKKKKIWMWSILF